MGNRCKEMKREIETHKTKKQKSKAKHIIHKLLKQNKIMAENIEDKDENVKQNEQERVENAEKEATEKEIETRLEEEWKSKFEDLNKKYLLLYSDFENYRKRTAKEKAELIMTAAESTIKDLLPVVDDYERALQNLEKQDGEIFAKTKEGLDLIYGKLMNTLSKQGLKPINAKGEKFDESLHEAIARVPAQKEEEKGMVIDETTKGYYLKDKVIRYSKVVVAM